MNPVLHHPPEQALSEAEHAAHIQALGQHLQAAYARFEAHGNPADRDAAVQWLDLQNQAIAERDRLLGAQRHAAFERRLDEGVDFFAVQGLRDAQAMASRGHAG